MTESVSALGAPEGIRTPNLLIRRQPRPVGGGLSSSIECCRWTCNVLPDLRRQSNGIHCSLWPSMAFGRRVLDEL